jgi:(R)-2-hydroxyacyl-CoA dehydratese activating ATPase
MNKTFLLGVDLGSTTSKAILLNQHLEILGQHLLRSGRNPAETAEELRNHLLQQAGIDPAGQQFHLKCIATGYGRSRVAFADSRTTEISCHARGVKHLHPDCRTVIDIGGQDSKVISLSPEGLPFDFAMNDRCAAGTGAFLEVIARRFGTTVDDISRVHTRDPQPAAISATCVVFAETEVVGLVSSGSKLDDVLAGVQLAVATRVAQMAEGLGVCQPVYLSGGVAFNETVRLELEKALGISITRAKMPQLTGALGAALLAAKEKPLPDS